MNIKRIIVGPLATNCYVVAQGKKAFIVDPGGDADVISQYLKEKNLAVEFIVNTHDHVDHIFADYELGYPVYIHELDAPGLQEVSKNHSRLILGDFQPCKPARLLKDNDRIHFEDMMITVLHTPGHSPGGICLFMDSVLFSGDTLFKDGVGRTDLPLGSRTAIFNSIKNKLLTLDDATKVYPGHGPATTIGDERGNF